MENIIISELLSGNTFDHLKLINYSKKYNKKDVLYHIPLTEENIRIFQTRNFDPIFNFQAPYFDTLGEYSEYITSWYNSDKEILMQVNAGNFENLTPDIYLRWFRYFLPYCTNLNMDLILDWINKHHPEDLYKTIIDNCFIVDKKKYLDLYNCYYDIEYLKQLDSQCKVDFCMSNIDYSINNYINSESKDNFYILKYKNKELCLDLFLESTIRFHFFINKLGYYTKEITIEDFDEVINIYYNEYQKYDSRAYYIYCYREEIFGYGKNDLSIISDEYKIFYYNYKLEMLIDISKYNNIVNFCKKYNNIDLDNIYNLYQEELISFMQHLMEIQNINVNFDSKYIELIYYNIPEHVRTDFVKYLLVKV